MSTRPEQHYGFAVPSRATPCWLYFPVTRPVPAPSDQPAPESVRGESPYPAERATSDLQLAVARRIVRQSNPDQIELSARALVTGGSKHGIDLSLVWATWEADPARPSRRRARQTCLAVIGSGRTALLFLSEPPPEGDAGGTRAGITERRTCIEATCRHLQSQRPQVVKMAQALTEPSHGWAKEAYLAAGFLHVGNLTYLRRAAPSDQVLPPPNLGDGVELRTYGELEASIGRKAADATFGAALSATYEQTLDCPELCGMRSIEDVLDSHRSTGQFDSRLWWVMLERAAAIPLAERKPLGCLLLNPCKDQQTIELVYIGLAPEARGKGWAKPLLLHGMSVSLRGRRGYEVACAVDDRNTPARNLYASLGFRESGHRVALVKSL